MGFHRVRAGAGAGAAQDTADGTKIWHRTTLTAQAGQMPLDTLGRGKSRASITFNRLTLYLRSVQLVTDLCGSVDSSKRYCQKARALRGHDLRLIEYPATTHSSG